MSPGRFEPTGNGLVSNRHLHEVGAALGLAPLLLLPERAAPQPGGRVATRRPRPRCDA